MCRSEVTALDMIMQHLHVLLVVLVSVLIDPCMSLVVCLSLSCLASRFAQLLRSKTTQLKRVGFPIKYPIREKQLVMTGFGDLAGDTPYTELLKQAPSLR